MNSFIVVLFPAPLGPKGHDLAPMNLERDIFHGGEIAVMLGEADGLDGGDLAIQSFPALLGQQPGERRNRLARRRSNEYSKHPKSFRPLGKGAAIVGRAQRHNHFTWAGLAHRIAERKVPVAGHCPPHCRNAKPRIQYAPTPLSTQTVAVPPTAYIFQYATIAPWVGDGFEPRIAGRKRSTYGRQKLMCRCQCSSSVAGK